MRFEGLIILILPFIFPVILEESNFVMFDFSLKNNILSI